MSQSLPARHPDASETIMHELVLPSHTNALDSAFGGTIMSWVDICGAISAQRHSRGTVVTAAIDQLNFLCPVHRGDTVRLTGRVTHVGRTSMEIRVIVDVIDTTRNEEQRSGIAYITYVAIDDEGHARAVPPLDIDNTDDRRRFEAGKERRKHRLAVRDRKIALVQNEDEPI